MTTDDGINPVSGIPGFPGIGVKRVVPKARVDKKERSPDEKKKNRAGGPHKDAGQPAGGKTGTVDIEV